MLKFVSTKPPRGRSHSGSLSPDREATSSPRSHQLPPRTPRSQHHHHHQQHHHHQHHHQQQHHHLPSSSHSHQFQERKFPLDTTSSSETLSSSLSSTVLSTSTSTTEARSDTENKRNQRPPLAPLYIPPRSPIQHPYNLQSQQKQQIHKPQISQRGTTKTLFNPSYSSDTYKTTFPQTQPSPNENKFPLEVLGLYSTSGGNVAPVYTTTTTFASSHINSYTTTTSSVPDAVTTHPSYQQYQQYQTLRQDRLRGRQFLQQQQRQQQQQQQQQQQRFQHQQYQSRPSILHRHHHHQSHQQQPTHSYPSSIAPVSGNYHQAPTYTIASTQQHQQHQQPQKQQLHQKQQHLQQHQPLSIDVHHLQHPHSHQDLEYQTLSSPTRKAVRFSPTREAILFPKDSSKSILESSKKASRTFEYNHKSRDKDDGDSESLQKKVPTSKPHKFQDGAIQNQRFQDRAIQSQKFQDSAIPSQKFADGAIAMPTRDISEIKVMTSCVPPVANDLSNDALNKNQSFVRSVGPSSQTASTMSSTMREMLNRSHEQVPVDGILSLDVVYITERIISMTFPSEGHDTTYSFNLMEVVRMLKTKHGDNYMILNLSEKRQDLTKANPQVKDYGWPDHMAPPLERLCSLCKAMDSWLNANIHNVVVLHCKGGRSRIASVIAAYMHYSNICASADQALDRFAMKRFYDDKLGGLPLPSQRRYVRYFSGLLSGAIKINSNPLYLHHILIHGVPNFDTKGGCRPFIKVYQGMQPIFTSGVYNVTDNMQKVCISISPGIPLRGDILIKCYHKKTRSGQREVIWQCQFHTCAISDDSLVFSKQELDDAIMDPRFPDNGKVEFVFGPSSDVLVSVSGFKSDVTVPVDDNEETLARSDSYENFQRNLETIEGYAGHNTSFTSHYTSSATTSHNNINNNNISKPPSSSDHPYHHPASSPSAPTTTHKVPRQQTPEERSQLDDLLSDLLSEQAYVSPSQASPQSFTTATQSQPSPQLQQPSPREPAAASHHPVSSSLSPSTGPNMNNAKTVTTTTRTYTNYTTSDSLPNPDKVLIQRAEVTYKLPGQSEVKDHYTIAADPSQVLDTSSHHQSKAAPGSHHYVPKSPQNAFSYTSGVTSSSTSSTQRTQQQRAEVVEHEIIRMPAKTGSLQSTPPPASRLPYRPDYTDSSHTPKSPASPNQYQYSSLDSEANAWLQQQQQKLKNFKEGRDSTGRTEAEKKLVNELRFAQNKYYTRRTQSEDEEKAMMDSYNRQALHSTSHNGPVSSMPPYTHQRSNSMNAVDGWSVPQQQQYSYQTSSSSYMESRSYGEDKRSNKPPPSPTMQRSLAPPQNMSSAAPPAPIPARSSSKEFMRTRSNSSSNTWQQQQQHHYQPQRPLQRQQSDIIYDRNREVEHVIPKSYGSTRSTPQPVMSPRAPSPVGPTSTTTYTQYRTLTREQKAPPPQPPQPPPPPHQVNHHYITEVYVHRQDKDKTDSTRLEELEKNLERAQQSILQQQQVQQVQQQPIQPVQQQPIQQVQQQQPVQSAPPPKQPPPVEIAEEMVRSHTESRQFQQFAESKPEPPRVKEIEEDRIMLRPIGPGVQTLEPETAHTGTLGRPTTPGFPSAPATPPFPTTLRATNQHLSTGPIQNHTGPHQQQQTFQYQQQFHQSQQYQTHHEGPHGGQGTLHIDTSPKMLSARSPSANSPPSPGNINTLRQQLNSAHTMSNSVVSPGGPHSMTGQSSPSVYFGLSRRGSLSSLADNEMVHTTPKFVKDTSKFWYKPHISREEAIQMLKDKQPGTFVIRDSNSFPGAFGLALKVASIPANVQAKPSGDPQADLVRHFLIEPTPKGVRLRGCSNEPVFGSLAAMVYQHSVTPLALPCKLSLPESDVVDGLAYPESPMNTPDLNSAAILLAQGAACNVVYINSVDMESLTGPQAVAKAVKSVFDNPSQGKTTVVHFKVSIQGITLTDNNRKLFFRRHYPVSAVTFCGMDPQDRRWKRELDAPGGQGDAKIFGFVARKQNSANENSCHIFSELDPEQPASAIVNFVTKVMIGQTSVKSL